MAASEERRDPAPPLTSPDGRALPFDHLFQAVTLDGIKLATQGRLISLTVVALLLLYLVPFPAVIYYEVLIILSVLLGVMQYWLYRNKPQGWVTYGFIAIDFALLGFIIFSTNPWAAPTYTPQMVLRNDPIVYYFLLLVSVAFSYTPGLMLWAGGIAALSWIGGGWWIWRRPESFSHGAHPPDSTPEQVIADHLHPNFVDTDLIIQDAVLLVLVASILAFVVRRSRHLVIRQAQVARERASLARYFSPNVLDEIVEHVGPLTSVRKDNVAILFADIVGFTQLCETMPPENVMELLRTYHSRLEEQVFRLGGTLDKFIGDAVMASFGAPRPGPSDATQGLRCARAMLDTIAEWNRERVAVGEVPIYIGIGLHYGPAVMGDVGSERCAAFAVIGDTTNTTSRLQSLTRNLSADIVASHTLLEEVKRETSETTDLLTGFQDAGQQSIRGRQNPMHIWMLEAERAAQP